MSAHRVVIVGAAAAGLATAEALREREFDGEIVLIGEEAHPPYDRPPLSKQLLAGTEGFEFVALAAGDAFDGIDLRLGSRAVGLDQDARQVRLADGSALDYDTCVIATGVQARRIPGLSDLAGVLALRGYDDALALRERLVPGARLVIIGAGFIGLEVAATARKAGAEVDVVELAPSPLLGRFPAELARRIQAEHEANGVRFHFGVGVESWSTRADGSIAAITLADGTELPADAVLVGVGTAPAVGWLDESGLTIDNGIVTDERGLAAEHVYAVGDVANWYEPRLGRQHRVEHRLNAGEQAQIVAASITGTEAPELDLPFFWTDQYAGKWQLYGYSHPDAELDIVLDETEAGRLVALLRRDGRIEAVVGRNAAKQLMPYRRELKTTFTSLTQRSA